MWEKYKNKRFIGEKYANFTKEVSKYDKIL